MARQPLVERNYITKAKGGDGKGKQKLDELTLARRSKRLAKDKDA